MKIKKTLLISIICGVLAIILSAMYLHMKEMEVAGGGELREVLVAARDIDEYSLMEPGFVKVKKIPRIFIQPGALRELREIHGMVNIAAIRRGEQLLGTKLVVGGQKSGLSAKITNGKRAVSISLSEADAAGGLIRPDDYIDVLVTFDYGNSEQSDKYTYALFQNVEVLAVGKKMHSLRNPEGIAIIKKKSDDLFGSVPRVSSVGGANKIVTLALNPDEAGKLIFAREAGKITLTLRSPMDKTIAESRPIKIETLTGKAGFTRRNYREYRGR